MQLRTLFLYLIGSRQAILTIARSKQALWIALLFVLSAGFAREYDQEDLSRNPAVLLLPLVASFLAATVLFVCVVMARMLALGDGGLSLSDYYAPFLGLFWMTAPLAWLYAVPHEQFLPPVGSTTANLITLGLVSLWRVLLMIRVTHVLFGLPLARAFFLVMLFANVIAYIGLSFIAISLVGVMGGIRSLSPSEQLVQGVTRWILGASCFTLPLWLGEFVVSLCVEVPGPPEPLDGREGSSPRSSFLWGLAGLSLLVWIGILPLAQPRLKRAEDVKDLYYSNQVGEAMDILSRYSPEDFPPYWGPPPEKPEWVDTRFFSALEHIASHETSPWVRELYLQKATSLVQYSVPWYEPKYGRELFDLLKRIPGGTAVIREAIQSDSVWGEEFQKVLKERETSQ
jgi:hypothetical protein